ncbi:membrane protein insertion efficiency factor YidD [Roseiconus lacunae]|uniref:membrane protein insertion efficiency factor YidD n=1 Tax=Roseiconus lacunae TaxID=2605694 RepID=UPI003F51756D
MIAANGLSLTRAPSTQAPPLPEKASVVIARILIGCIRGYQSYVSPLFPPRCRFRPTCSQYAVEAIRNCGPLRGTWYAIVRILKCHPLHPGGEDPAPQGRQTGKDGGN